MEKMDSFWILQIPHAFTHTPVYTLNHLTLAHSHGSFLFQKSSFFFSFMLSDFSLPSRCLRGSLPLSRLRTQLIFLDVSMKKTVKVNSLLLFEIIKSFSNQGFQSDKVLQECQILLLASGASHDTVQLGFVSKHMFMLPLRIWKNCIGLKQLVRVKCLTSSSDVCSLVSVLYSFHVSSKIKQNKAAA